MVGHGMPQLAPNFSIKEQITAKFGSAVHPPPPTHPPLSPPDEPFSPPSFLHGIVVIILVVHCLRIVRVWGQLVFFDHDGINS